MLSGQNPLVAAIKIRFQQWATEYPKQEGRTRGEYENLQKEHCKKLYLEVKNFFDVNQDALSPTDKMKVLDEYFFVWENNEGILSIIDTDFVNHYSTDKELEFSAQGCHRKCPMMAGFNLKNIEWNRYTTNYNFFSVDFRGADLGNETLAYGRFYGCDFRGASIGKANFNKSEFWQCDLRKVDFSVCHLSETRFTLCTLFQTIIPITSAVSTPKVIDCHEKPPYPSFLKDLHVRQKDLAAGKVAHALWIQDKDPENTKRNKFLFWQWAKGKSLGFEKSDVEECFKRYEMK